MGENYYTPEISEFHIGFEYEYSEYGRKIWINETADFDDISLAFSIYEDANHEFPSTYRVKFIDREDIESLGFTFFGCRLMEDNVTCDYPRVFSIKEPRDETKFGHNPKILYMICEVGPNLFDIENMVTKTKTEKIFIKNKSELKKILTQLSVVYGK